MDWFLKPVEVLEYDKRKFEIATLLAIPKNRNSKMNFIAIGEENHHSLEELKNREDLSVGMLKIKEKRSKLTYASEKISCEVINLLNFKFVRELDDPSGFDLDMQLSLVTNRVLLDSNYHIFANSYEYQFKPEHYDFHTYFKVVSNFYDNNEIAVKNFLYLKEEAIDGYIRKINVLSFNDQSVLSIPIPFVQKIYEAN